MSTNEPIVSYHHVERSSDRSFGLVIGAFFALVGLWPVIFAASAPRWGALLVAVTFVGLAVAAPKLLRPLNKLWFSFGLLLHNVVNPVLMAAMFFGAFLPIGLWLRLLGKDLLRLKRDASVESYWITRHPPGPDPASMLKQF